MSTKTGRGADVVHRAGGGEERERRRDDLVAAPDVERAHGEEQRIRAVRAPDRVLRLRQLGDSRSSRSTGSPRMNSWSSTTCIIARDDLVADRRVLRLEVEQRNGHGSVGGHRNYGLDASRGESSRMRVTSVARRHIGKRERHFAARLRRLVDAEDQLERFSARAAVVSRLCLAAQHREHVAVVSLVAESVDVRRVRVDAARPACRRRRSRRTPSARPGSPPCRRSSPFPSHRGS